MEEKHFEILNNVLDSLSFNKFEFESLISNERPNELQGTLTFRDPRYKVSYLLETYGRDLTLFGEDEDYRYDIPLKLFGEMVLLVEDRNHGVVTPDLKENSEFEDFPKFEFRVEEDYVSLSISSKVDCGIFQWSHQEFRELGAIVHGFLNSWDIIPKRVDIEVGSVPSRKFLVSKRVPVKD
jgi:hypothetical protein